MVMMENGHALDLAHHHRVDPVLAHDRALQRASAVVRDHAPHDRNPAHAVDHPKNHDLRSIWTKNNNNEKEEVTYTD